MPNFENAFNTVCELVNDFKENEHIYLSYKYNESQARKDYIDKFFIALGWDVNHTLQKNPHKQEVKVEQTLDNQSRPDYTFYLEPNFKEPKFFVEAKKPCRDLLNAGYYFQAINYARSASTHVTVLTDFQEFHILDSRYKPNINTVLKDQNHLVFKYTDYADREKFAEIYYLFSRDDVAKNSLKDYADKLTASDKKRKKSGYAKGELLSIDEEFLLYLDNIRVRLAKAFKKADASLSSEELTEATQRTIDRLVFIRFLEDKNIEPEDFISKLGASNKAWNDFITVCRKLDAKYNGIVFKEQFIDSQNFGGPELGEFKNVCFEFSRKNSLSFNYNLIPIHILGSIYERFLGKVVNATAQRVKVEEKPEVRKAGGVYYTPKYIVDYIVDNTVGKILNNCHSSESRRFAEENWNPEDGNSSKIPGKTPAQISKLRFADIACGSGSFLIGVFETLLDYHNNYYWLNQEEAKKDGCIFKDGAPFLSIKQKQNILLNNIYGVDIDPQAVEVTQLSLALKMLEDESLATANEMQVLFHEKILPDLSKNIICGNSLIGTDIIYEDSSEAGLFERKRRITIEEERKLNPMDFEKRFPHIFSKSNTTTLSFPNVPIGNPEYKGGFDAIVGNPPYFNLQVSDSLTKEYLKYKYKSFAGKADILYFFIERAISKLNKTGTLGYITSRYFLEATDAKQLRTFIVNNSFVDQLIDFSNYYVFKGVGIHTLISIFSNNQLLSTKVKVFENKLSDNILDDVNFKSFNIEINTNEWLLSKENEKHLINKLNIVSIKLIDIATIEQGQKTGLNSVFGISKAMADDFEKEPLKKLIKNSHINRYFVDYKNVYLIYTDSMFDIDKYPKLKEYLLKHQKELKQRAEACDNKYEWYRLQRPRDLALFESSEKIVVPYRAEYNRFAYDDKQYFNDGGDIRIIVINKEPKYSTKYVLGILNSKLMNFFYNFIGRRKGKVLEYFVEPLGKIPIKTINFDNTIELQSHDRIVSLVNEMLEAKKHLQTIKTDRDKTYYENKCSDLDNAIDFEVYKLYALTPEEIKIVEGKE